MVLCIIGSSECDWHLPRMLQYWWVKLWEVKIRTRGLTFVGLLNAWTKSYLINMVLCLMFYFFSKLLVLMAVAGAGKGINHSFASSLTNTIPFDDEPRVCMLTALIYLPWNGAIVWISDRSVLYFWMSAETWEESSFACQVRHCLDRSLPYHKRFVVTTYASVLHALSVHEKKQKRVVHVWNE